VLRGGREPKVEAPGAARRDQLIIE